MRVFALAATILCALLLRASASHAGEPDDVAALAKALQSRNPEQRSNAIQALGELGAEAKEAVPALLTAFRKGSPEDREAIARALWAIGPAAEAAIPTLIEALDDADVRDAAIEALWNIKDMPEDDVAALVALVRPGDKKAVDRGEAAWRLAARGHAMYLLGWMGSKAHDAIPVLAEAISDPDPAVRLAAAEALWRIEKRPERVLPILIAAVQSRQKNADPRWAVYLVGEIGPQARKAVPALAQALSDPDLELRCRAAEALWEIEARPERLIPTLIALIEATEEYAPEGALWWDLSYIRCRAAAVLGKIGPEARQAVPALIKAIEGGDSILSGSAIDALAEMGLEAKKAVPTMVEHLGDQRAATVFAMPHGIHYVGETAWIALGKMNPDAVNPLTGALTHKDKNVRMRAALALHDLGPQAKPAVGALIAALKDPDEEVRRYAARALGAIGPEAQAAIPVVIEAIDDREWVVRMEAAPALVRIDAKSPQAVAAIRKALSDADANVQASAVEAIGVLGADAKPFVPHAARLLGSREQHATAYGSFHALAQTAADALAKLGPEAREAAPALVEVLQEDRDRPTRGTVVEALVRIGPAAKGVLPDLLRVCRDIPEAALAVLYIDPQNDKVLPHLIAALERSEGRSVSDEVVRALAILGRRGKPSLPLLVKRFENGDVRDRKLVGWALIQIDPRDSSEFETFLEALKAEVWGWVLPGLPDDEWQLALARLGPRIPRVAEAFAAALQKGGDVAHGAAEALGRIGPLSAPAAPAIVEHLDERRDENRRPLVTALARIGPAGLRHVVPALKDERTWVAVGATEVLAEMGKEAAPAIPALTEALLHPRVRVRAAAAAALGKLGPTAASAIPALKEACRDGYETVRQPAQEAIRKIAPDEQSVPHRAGVSNRAQ